MRYIINSILCLTFLTPALSSCVRDSLDGGSGREDELPVTIALDAPATRSGATIEGSEADYEIDGFRMMGFRTGDGSLAFNQSVTFTQTTGTGGSDTQRKATVHVLTGSFTVVFIANEQLDAGLSSQLAGIQPNVAKIDELRSLSFDISALDWKSGNTNLVPMAEVCERVLITGNDRLSYNGLTINGGEWSVPITRMAVRIDLSLKLTAAQLADFDHIRFGNVPDKLFLFGETDNNASTRDDIRYPAAANNSGYTLAPGHITTLSSGDYAAEITYPRILLPEAWFSPVDDKDLAVVLSAVIDGEDYPARIGWDIPDDYTLPRNLYYDIDAVIADEGADLEITLGVNDWDMAVRDGLLGHKSLNVSAVKASINERNMARIFFWSDQQDVYIENLDGNGDPVNAIFYDLAGSGASNFHYDPSTGEGWFDLITDRNALGAGTDQSYKIYLNAGGGKFSREITVDVAIPSTDFAAYNYVGAFWRNDQKGERIIAAENSGPWSAAASESWIVLEEGKSLDPNLWTSGKEPADAEEFPVENGSSSISGSGKIYFRIGLTGYNTTGGNRYGKVTVTPGSGTSFDIYIRQGEDPDYLMRPGTTDGNSTITDRNLATKFPPYNLTSPEYLTGANSGGASVAEHSQLPVNGGTFAEYPSQAGAYFQWANEVNPRYSYHPYNPMGVDLAGWNQSNTYIGQFWETLRETQETCPAGYRRPNDGTISGNLDPAPVFSESEMRQSLWLNPQDGTTVNNRDNFVLGYYADGFFDRRPITSELWAMGPDCVNTSDHRMAYMGGLFFNPATSASLFFPMAGGRAFNSGMVAGIYGSYWTSAAKLGTNPATSTLGGYAAF